MRGYVVGGTSSGVGKTVATLAMLRALSARVRRPAGEGRAGLPQSEPPRARRRHLSRTRLDTATISTTPAPTPTRTRGSRSGSCGGGRRRRTRTGRVSKARHARSRSRRKRRVRRVRRASHVGNTVVESAFARGASVGGLAQDRRYESVRGGVVISANSLRRTRDRQSRSHIQSEII